MVMSNATADTLQKVAGEFEGEVLAEIQEGREQSLKLIQASKKETAEAVSKILETSTKQAEALRRQIIGAAELEARNSQLKVLEEAVEEVFSMAVTQITKLDDKRHEAALKQLLTEAIEVIGPNAMVSTNSKDAKEVFGIAKGIKGEKARLTPGDKRLETIGGIVLTTPDKSIRFDNTFEARLERLRPNLRKEVAAVLNG
jgi:V/A-type H+/Na+-transporting ATPase subunit E